MTQPLSFFTPEEYRDWRKVRGWLLPVAAEQLYQSAAHASPDGAIVEIGSAVGKSTVCIARAVRDRQLKIPSMTAIDVRFRPKFRPNLEHFGVSHLVRSQQEPSLEAAERWMRPISFLYIDAHHGKRHAYADLLAWDPVVLPGSVVALDDTAGFMIGPNMQLQMALQTKAYELITEVGGISFLKKHRPLVPFVSDYPLAIGSLIAYVQFIGAWTGAFDPACRIPHSFRQPDDNLNTFVGRVKEKLSRRPVDPVGTPTTRESSLEEPRELLDWLEQQPILEAAAAHTLSYLRACLDAQLGQLDRPLETLKTLAAIRDDVEFIHYRIKVTDLALLRLAQLHDLRGERPLAVNAYARLVGRTAVPEIRSQAEQGSREPFRTPELTGELLVREYNSSLAPYRTILPNRTR